MANSAANLLQQSCIGKVLNILNIHHAQMAELVDALVSGTSVRKYVQVRVLFWAQEKVKGPS